MSAKILVSTAPFGVFDDYPLQLLNRPDVQLQLNPFDRRLTELELIELVREVDVIIAGTEPITARVMEAAKELKLISRVGVGLDSVDLLEARTRGISVSYTPEAPVLAVAELALGLSLSLLRQTHHASRLMQKSVWQRFSGRRVSDVVFGVIGVGRIGGEFVRSLLSLGAQRILINDLHEEVLEEFASSKIRFCTKDQILESADLISLHVPLTSETRGLIGKQELLKMKSDALLVNTSRGGVVDEKDLLEALNLGRLGGVAIDVFESEPYYGPLIKFDRCILTAHMGSMSRDCRARMEIEATEEVIRYLDSSGLMSEIPEQEYLNQMSRVID